MSRKIISTLVLITMVLTMVAFSGCGNGNGTDTQSTPESTTATADTGAATAEQKQVTIDYDNFSAGEAQATVLENMIAAFEKANPNIKVNNNPVGYGEIFTRLATEIAANNAPDCFELNMENFQAFALRNSVAELGPVISSAGLDTSVYNQGALKACTLNGKQYGLPLSYSTCVLFYNKDLFDKAGVAYPTKDWTWKEELEAAQKIKALDADTWGVFQEIQFWEFYKTVQKSNGKFLSDDNKTFTMNRAENIETLQYMADRIWKYKVMPSDADRADRSGSDLFVAGKLGMLYGGIWQISDVVKKAPDMKWGVEIEPGNKKKACFFFSNIGCVSPTSKNADAAAKFLYELGTNKDIVNMRLDAQWELPTISDPEMLKKYTSITPPENKQAIIDSMTYAVNPPALEQFQQFSDIVNPQLQALQADNSKSAKEILDGLQNEVTQKITIK